MKKLNESERQVFNLIYLPNKEISKKLNLSESTIKTYVHNLLEYFNVKTRVGLLIKGIKMGVINLYTIDIAQWDAYEIDDTELIG